MLKNRLLKVFSTAVLLLMMFSCNKEPDIVGLDLLPGGDRLGVDLIDTLDILAHTVREDSLRTSELAINLLGHLNDDIFGQVNASIYTQYRLEASNVKFGADAVADSMFLTLVYAGRYGDTLSPQHIKVYELDEKLIAGKDYYSNGTHAVKSTPIGDITFVPDFSSDTVKKLPPMLRIPLSYEFMQKLITADESTLSSNKLFSEVFKGLYLEADPSAISGVGSMLYFNLLHVESKLQLFYHNADTASTLTFNINESTIKYNHYEQDYSAAAPLLAQQLEGDSLAGEQKLYLQAMAGTKVNLRIPNIGSIPGKEKIAINEALLVFTNAEPQSILAPPLQLSLRLYVDSKKYVIFPEENYNALYFGGRYRNNGEYQFRITKYVQERIMYPEMPDYGMVLLVSGAALSSNRLVLYGPGSDTSAVKLKIYYSMNGL